MPDINPPYDKDSEQAQALRDKAEKIYAKSLNDSAGLLRRQTLERLDDFFSALHPDSHMSKILCDCWDKQDCTDFGFYLMKYVDEYEAEKTNELSP